MKSNIADTFVKIHICNYIKSCTLTKHLQVQLHRHNVFVSGKSYADRFRLIIIIFYTIFFPDFLIFEHERQGIPRKKLNKEST